MSATDNIARTWDGEPLYCSETERELYAIARIQANPLPDSSKPLVEGETLARWADDGGQSWD
jgi:hypothetical protein